MPEDKEFKILIENLSVSYWQFCLNEIMHEKIGGQIYKDFVSFWGTTLLGLESSYMLGLAKFFDKPKELDETISIYYFLDFEQKEIIGKLRKIRNKLLTHIDKKTALTKDTFMKELGLTFSDISTLFDTAIDLVDKIKGKFGIIWDVKKHFREGGEEIKKEFEAWFDVFQKGFINSQPKL